MKTFICSILFLALLISGLTSQTCLPNRLNISRQGQIDSFQINFPGCAHVEGFLNISGDVTNLLGLSAIQSIGGLAIMGTENLESLKGLESLKEIDGQLRIANNQKLKSLSALINLGSISGQITIEYNDKLVEVGLWNLKTLGGDLGIYDNELLHDLDGLNSLTEIGGDLTIYESNFDNLKGLHNLKTVNGDVFIIDNKLVSLSGLDSLRFINFSCTIADNLHLTSLHGLEQLEFVDGDFSIRYNTALKNITALSGLRQISGMFSLISLPNLVSLEGLEQLTDVEGIEIYLLNKITDLKGLTSVTTVFGNLGIGSNPRLVSLEGLNNLQAVAEMVRIELNDALIDVSALNNVNQMGSLALEYNINLSLCNAHGICHHLSSGGTNSITGQPVGCQTAEQILQTCITSIDKSTLLPLKIYPNPITDQLIVESSEDMEEIFITDSYGKKCVELTELPNGQRQQIINTSSLVSGIYFVSIASGIHYQTIKMIKI